MIAYFKQKNKRNNFTTGFTLVETLVAVSIFTISILASITVLSNGITSTNYAKQKATATYLAQEGIEYMRNMRDTFMLYDGTSSQNGWNLFNSKIVTASCNASNGCYFADLSSADFANQTQPMASLAVTACGSNCPSLLYDSATGKYNYTTGTASGLRRRIKITQPSANETVISSTAFWTQGSGTYSITFSENLFNWIEQ